MQRIFCGALIGLSLAAPGFSMLQTPAAFGEKYRTVSPIVKELTQVVYYRVPDIGNHREPANVYVDGRYHTSLLTGGYTSFCLKPGEHTLGAFINDPYYRGKTEGRFTAYLQGGRTYFLRVDEEQQLNQPPVAVRAQQGEQEVKQTHRQIHARSRAINLQPCVYDRASAQPESVYLFRSGQLFKQDLGHITLSDAGIQALNELAVTLRQQHPLLHSVVLSFTARDGEQLMGEKAKAIRTSLSLSAVPNALIRSEFAPCSENCPADAQDIQILVR